MVKVTKLNVTRFSEDGLYLALANLNETDEMYVIIEAELDRRIEVEARQLEARHEAQLASLRLTQEIQLELQQIFNGFRGKKTLILIEHLGQEFIEDYSIDESTFTVYSKVYDSFRHCYGLWQMGSIEQARSKMASLIYDRIYNKFMRDSTKENLELLKRVLGGYDEKSNIRTGNSF